MRLERERANVWWGAMLPHLKKPIPLDRFVQGRKQVKRQSAVELQAMLDALAAAWGAKKVTQDGN